MRTVVASREGMSDGSEGFGRLRFLMKRHEHRSQYTVALSLRYLEKLTGLTEVSNNRA